MLSEFHHWTDLRELKRKSREKRCQPGGRFSPQPSLLHIHPLLLFPTNPLNQPIVLSRLFTIYAIYVPLYLSPSPCQDVYIVFLSRFVFLIVTAPCDRDASNPRDKSCVGNGILRLIARHFQITFVTQSRQSYKAELRTNYLNHQALHSIQHQSIFLLKKSPTMHFFSMSSSLLLSLQALSLQRPLISKLVQV